MNHLDFIAPDILIEQDSEGKIWLTQDGMNYPFPRNMEFTREIVNLREERYLACNETYDCCLPRVNLRPAH